MKNYKSEPVKTCLTISMGFLIVFMVTKLNWAPFVALAVGLTGLFSPFLSRKIDFLWMKLAGVLSLIVPNILLGAVFYLFLFPISLLAKLFRKNDPLLLNNTSDSTFTTRNKPFDKGSFENPW